MSNLPGPDALAAGLTHLTASSPFDGGCLPCQERQQGVALSSDPGEETPGAGDLGASAPGPGMVAWEGVLCVEGEMTGDGRMIAANALRVDELPIPLRYVSSDVGAHDGAVVVGTINKTERSPREDGAIDIVGRGFIDLNTSAGAEAVRGVLSGAQPGVSLDLDSVSFEVHVAEELVAAKKAAEGGEGDTVEIPRTEDGHYIVSKVSSSDEIMMTTDGRIRAATLVAIPAFASAKLAITDPDAARDALTAAGGPDIDLGSAPSGTVQSPLEDGSATEAFNWVDDEGGLPGYIDRIRKHLEAKGMATSHAIAVAVNAVKKMCATGDVNVPGAQQVSAGSQAEACDAVAQWEAMKAKHASVSEAYTVDDEVEAIPAGSSSVPECAFPECGAPAVLLVPLMAGDETPVDVEELSPDADAVPYCQEHADAVLPEIGHLKTARSSVPLESAVTASASLRAGAAPDAPPAEWFRSPGLTQPTALTITDEGRVFGHLAAWNTCHTSHTAQGQCVLAPRTATNYAYFHTGAVLTDEGTEERVGHITMDTRHAGGTLSPGQTMSHYEDTGTTIADVAVGEDAHGIWFSGALRPWATAKQIRQLRSSPLSGDWRRAGNNLELVAALAVNVPGFPVPRPQGLVASGHVQSLIAGGMLAPSSITDHVTASAGNDPAASLDSLPEGLPGDSGSIGSRPSAAPGLEDVTPTVADHLTPEDLAYLKSLAARERDALRAEAGEIVGEIWREQARELAESVLSM